MFLVLGYNYVVSYITKSITITIRLRIVDTESNDPKGDLQVEAGVNYS